MSEGREAQIIVRADRERMFEKRHPWLFSGAIRAVQGRPADGDMVAVVGESGAFLARGYWNSHSQIRVHLLTWQDEPITPEFWRVRLARAIQARASFNQPDGAARLVNAENDALPGLIVDRYGEWLVMQALTMGIERRKQEIAQMLMELLAPQQIKGIYERSDVDVREKEGLPPVTGVLLGEAPPAPITIREWDYRLSVDVYKGHKTGFYLDQATNRRWLAAYIRQNPQTREVLNCFSYTGGFSVAALKAGAARVINLDSSGDALALAKQNYDLNDLTIQVEDFVMGDVFQVLRQYRAEGRQFDAIILDPPKFVHHQGQIERASRGYKDINLLAFQLLRPGGLLLTFSCSGLVDPDLFQKIVFGALVDSKREAQIVARLTAGEDHPVGLHFPEGLYLKGLACRVW